MFVLVAPVKHCGISAHPSGGLLYMFKLDKTTEYTFSKIPLQHNKLVLFHIFYTLVLYGSCQQVAYSMPLGLYPEGGYLFT